MLDVASGLRGIVELAERDRLTHGGRYQVRVADGRIVWRVDTELEPDPTPAPVVS